MQNNAKELRNIWDKVWDIPGYQAVESSAACLLAEGLGDKAFWLLRTKYRFGEAQEVHRMLRDIVEKLEV